MAEDPYKLLGVSPKASEAEIRKAFRALAKELHPDVNPDPKAAERFKKINAAYTLLSDKDMKARYDSGQVDGSGQQQNPFAGGRPFGSRGPNGQAGGFQGGGFDDMSDLFSSLFGMQMGGNRGGARLRPQKGSDIRFALTLNFADAVKGAQKSVKMSNGQTLKIKIPAGTEEGAVLRLRGKGDPGRNGGPNGDAKVEITVKTHKYFRRDGNDLRIDLPITLLEAVEGSKVRVPTTTGSVTVTIPKGASSGKTLRLKGKGVKGGDLYVRLNVVLPDNIDTLGEFIADNAGLFTENPRKTITL